MGKNKLNNYKNFLFLLGYPGGDIETVNGTMRYKDWLDSEVERINSANPERQAEIYSHGGMVGVLAFNYHYDEMEPYFYEDGLDWVGELA